MTATEIVSECRAPRHWRQAVEDLRVELDRSEPGWTRRDVWCQWCRHFHVLMARDRQLVMPGPEPEPISSIRSGRRLPAAPVNAGDNFCRWHRTSSPALSARCVHCGTELHTHQDALGSARSGRAGQGFIIERCPACHRYNAVLPSGRRAIRTARLEHGNPVIQMELA